MNPHDLVALLIILPSLLVLFVCTYREVRKDHVDHTAYLDTGVSEFSTHPEWHNTNL